MLPNSFILVSLFHSISLILFMSLIFFLKQVILTRKLMILPWILKLQRIWWVDLSFFTFLVRLKIFLLIKIH